MKIFLFYLQVLDRFFPTIAAKLVYQRMSNPRIHKLRAIEEQVLHRSEMEKIRFKSFEIQKYSWGDKTHKKAFLVHGWEGQSGNFGALVDLLLAKKYYIIAFDAPSHGKSSKGKTSMFEYGAFIAQMYQQHKPKIILSHSYGSVTTAFALKNNPDVNLDQWFLITTPFDFRSRIQQMADMLKVSNKTIQKTISILESETQIPIDQLNMKDYGSDLKNLKEAVIIHSNADQVIPSSASVKTHEAIHQSELFLFEEMGHYKILWSKELIELLTKKIKPAL